MKDAGSGLMALAGLAILGGFFVDVSRSVGYPVGEVANLHAMHIQALIFQGGFFAFLSGAVLFAAGVINESIRTYSGPGRAEDAPEVVPATASDTGTADSTDAIEGSETADGDHWPVILVVCGLVITLVVAAIVATSSRPPAPTADNAIDMNVPVDMNAPYPALEPPVDLNAALPR